MQYELEFMPQNVAGESQTALTFQEQAKRIEEIENIILPSSELEMIKNNSFAPELLPQVNQPTEIQDVAKFEKADKKDMQEWFETAAEVLEVLPELSNIKLSSNLPFEDSPLITKPEGTDKEENNFSLFSNDMMFFSDAD